MGLSVIILAAGKGTRMRSALPKILHTMSGRAMIDYVVDSALKLSDDVTVVLYHQAERVEKHLTESFKGLRFVIQDLTNYPGTGGAVMDIKPKYENVLVLNGDMPLITANALEGFLEQQADIVMSVIGLDDPSGYGRVVIRENMVEAIVEQKDCTPGQLEIRDVNAGIYLFKHHVLETYLPRLSNDNAQQEYYLTDVIALARADGLAITPLWVDEASFKGVNSRADLAKAEEIMQERIKTDWMRQGVSMRLPQTIYIDSRVRFEGECQLENGVTLQGESAIKSSHIKAHCVIEDACIVDSTIGPMARIRPKSLIQESQIGNFVEVKKSTLKGVKAGHLSYLGDSEIDEGTNIGAGTITCNYDGIAKYQTIIGKNVFIGSDTQLVAPVTVGDDVLIAAGTTVTQDIPSGALAISRTPQKNKAGFFHKFFASKRKKD